MDMSCDTLATTWQQILTDNTPRIGEALTRIESLRQTLYEEKGGSMTFGQYLGALEQEYEQNTPAPADTGIAMPVVPDSCRSDTPP